ncbi:ABC transporter permease [Actinomadura kijaniata]|uniref:Transport permease protein n=1 Tax=Actinomadura namibiensis TaxID=182080 RepID=A0A7W3QQF9_ACTNM|nr:ABC transporter permease [Actinomadura namibiensis]MBA8955602.1 ABC-2 type transport system permease protein [Actinomadura namibiensis]
MSVGYAVQDTSTMLRRRMRHLLRYPSITLMLAGLPVVFLLLFVYVFGETLGAGLGGTSGGRARYIAYVTPGVILLAIGGSATGTSVSVAMDMIQGFVARYRTMAVFQPALLTSHVVGSVVQSLFSVVVVVVVAVAIGFRSHATVVEWLAAAGLVTSTSLAVTWLAVGLGVKARTVEGASNTPMPLTMLPFLGSGFVPTDSMPTALRWFAEYQPFTPITETLRGLLLGTAIGDQGWIAVAWCAGTSLVCFFWARRLFNRRTV